MTGMTVKDGQAELPTPHSTHSFWHQKPSELLLNHHTTERLPASADVIVIGTGIAGVFAARELVSQGRNVLMLEARDACWGATGRNGGHCQPRVHGVKAHIARFELATYAFIRDLVAEKNIPCDWKTTGIVYSVTSQREMDALVENIELLKKYHPDLAAQISLFTAKEDLEQLRVPNALAAILRPNAAKVWPYKLVAWILEDLIRSNDAETFNLQVLTPVQYVQRVGESWALHTPRGQVTAKQVLLATNAYTSHLLPKMTDLIVPVRGQVCALKPPKDAIPTKNTHGWIAKGQEDYFIEIGENNTIIFGGERLAVPGGGKGISRDDEIDPVLGQILRGACADNIKLRPNDKEEHEQLEADYEWTGIMGFSKDSWPWVGEVPENLGGGAGLWICAGFTGHGMPVAARCAVAVAEQVSGVKKTVELPSEYVVSEARIALARAKATSGDWLDELEAELATIKADMEASRT